MEDKDVIQEQAINEGGPKQIEEKTLASVRTQSAVTQQPKKQAQEDHDEQSNTLTSVVRVQSQRKFGNYIKIMDNSIATLTLGPDYLCFVPTFIFFSFIAYLLAQYINTHVQNPYIIVVTRIVCIIQPLSYLLVALSDPGIAHPLSQVQRRKLDRTMYIVFYMRFCRKCRFDVPESTLHCNYCDVCIIGYDHHCPWTSKCIGKGNLIQFYIFLFATPIFIVYSAFAFGFTIDAQPNNPAHLRTAGG